MPKSGKEIIALLQKNGWEVRGQKGSHVKLGSGENTTVVPVHGNRDLGKGLIKAIEKQTGVKLL